MTDVTATSTCDACGATLLRPRVIRGVTLGSECAEKFLLCRRALRAASASPFAASIADNWRARNPRMVACVEASR